MRLGRCTASTRPRSSCPPSITANQVIQGYPEFNIGESVPTLGSRASITSRTISHALFSTFTKTFGNHTLKFGTDYRLIRYNSENVGTSAAGSFSFSSTFTQADPFTASTSNTSGTALASVLLGDAIQRVVRLHQPAFAAEPLYCGFRAGRLEGRPQADAQFRTPLRTGNALYGALQPRRVRVRPRGDAAGAGPRAQSARRRSVRRRRTACRGAEGNVDTNNFGPRFGFAYQLSPKTVVRGGYGLFYSSQLDNIGGALGSVGTFDAVTPYVGHGR